jgi:hypothetical protein
VATGARDIAGDDQGAYEELCFYSLSHPDQAAFVHQHVVDAYAAQRAHAGVRPITLTFALVGLCLRVEEGRTGRQVQRVHTLLARQRRQWPRIGLPAERGAVTVRDVLCAPPGAERDRAIDRWCASVWHAYAAAHQPIRDLIRDALD